MEIEVVALDDYSQWPMGVVLGGLVCSAQVGYTRVFALTDITLEDARQFPFLWWHITWYVLRIT